METVQARNDDSLYDMLSQLREEVESLQQEEAVMQKEMDGKHREWEDTCFAMTRY